MSTQTTFAVTGMTCEHCERAVRTEVENIAGVTGVDVSAASGVLAVTSVEPVADEAILGAVAEAGYSAERA